MENVLFVIKYLKTFGFNVSNETFAENSWYFRNSLVRANYNDWQKLPTGGFLFGVVDWQTMREFNQSRFSFQKIF